MQKQLLTEIQAFIDDTGLSNHRAGILLNQNGRLVERLMDGGRVWPDTERKILCAIKAEREKRKIARKSESAA